MKILVTGAGALLGHGIIRALRRSSLQPQIVAVDPSPLSAGLYWADTAHLVPMASEPGYLDAMRKILSDERPDAVLVGTDVELHLFAAQRAEIETEFNTQVLVSDPRVVAIADDKWLTAQFFQESGFAHPASCLPGGEEALIEQVGFPLVVKPRVGARSIGVSLVHNRAELSSAVQGQPGVVIQECVGAADEEYTAGALYFDGRCNASIVMRRDLRDGNTYRAFSDAYPELNQLVRRWTEALKPHGPVNFQFRLRDGVAKVFEINGRFSGTTPLRTHAGFNEVELCLRRLLFDEPVRQPKVEPIVVLRHWSETIVRPGELLTGDSTS